jgi:phosphoribosylformylglycinamidine synthase I
MKAVVAVFPGSNREHDLARALERASGAKPSLLWHSESELPPGTDLVALPGGFAYGDYLRCGAIAARSPIMRAIAAHAERGGLVLGVCNGFQILCEAGLLPGVLVRNRDLKFLCRDVHLRIERSDTPFTRAYSTGDVIRVPVAHGEGNFIADSQTLTMLEGEHRVVFRYVDAGGQLEDSANVNGATNAIAGIVNERRNVLGMMPHPENAIEPSQGSTDGFGLFRSLAAAFEAVG